MLLQLIMMLMIMMTERGSADQLPTCQPQDFHYEYTQCGSDGGRWRVSVPRPNTCIGGAPNPPVRGKGCDFTCEAGEYLDMSGDQECHACAAGRYSLGGGVRYDDWDTVPTGFSVQVERFTTSLFYPLTTDDILPSSKTNCSGSGWAARSKYLASDVINCTAILTYTAELVRPGLVSFTYQHGDDSILFTFEVQNSRCESFSSGQKRKYLKQTQSGQWRTEKFELKTGVNVLYWRAFLPPTSTTRMRKPVLIQSIDISGVAYTSECTSCRAGTYSLTGSSSCTKCPANSYSVKGSSECLACDLSTQYSEAGSAECKERWPCTVDDFYEYQSTCDSYNKTYKTYKWIEPQLCRSDLPEAVLLPADGPSEDCPPCNPGMQPTSDGHCQFCPANHYSDGSRRCEQCPGSTAPDTRLVYKWWNNLPSDAGVSSSCLSGTDEICVTSEGWTGVSDHIYSNKGNGDDVYLILNIDVDGFVGKVEFVDGQPVPVGTVSFVFETSCTKQCTFLFMRRTTKVEPLVIETWVGSQEKTLYVYDVTSTSPVTFVWAFQKHAAPDESSDDDDDESSTVSLHDDVARIYSVEVTNPRSGGAASCKLCPQGASQDGCIPCPQGQYVDPKSAQCQPCPAGTVAHGMNVWGIESCIRCGEGLTALHGTSCVTSCQYNSTDGRQYDFTPLSGVQTVNGMHLFTTTGYKYFRSFQISLCAGGGDARDFPPAICVNNASLDMQNNAASPTVNKTVVEHNETADEDVTYIKLQSPICRSTILPPNVEDGTKFPVSVQPISLSDVLIAVTDNSSQYNITEKMTEAGFTTNKNPNLHDVHFVYVSDGFTTACRRGRMTIVTLRCDQQQSENGTVQLPPECPDGTCDGCVYLFLWASQFACPRCHNDNYTEVVEECRAGKQKVVLIKPKDCFSLDGHDTEVLREQDCSLIWQSHWPVWLKAVIVLVPVIVGLGVILLGILLHCWLTNKKLQYKYMKLVESASGKDGELPAAETCALDEGEEDEHFDAVEFKSKGRKFLKKFKKPSKKGYDEFHDVSNDHSSLLG